MINLEPDEWPFQKPAPRDLFPYSMIVEHQHGNRTVHGWLAREFGSMASRSGNPGGRWTADPASIRTINGTPYLQHRIMFRDRDDWVLAMLVLS